MLSNWSEYDVPLHGDVEVSEDVEKVSWTVQVQMQVYGLGVWWLSVAITRLARYEHLFNNPTSFTDEPERGEARIHTPDGSQGEATLSLAFQTHANREPKCVTYLGL